MVNESLSKTRLTMQKSEFLIVLADWLQDAEMFSESKKI